MRNRLLQSVILALSLAATSTSAISQQSENKAANPAPTVQSPKHYYKLSFMLRETDEGKVVNQRTFNASAEAIPLQAERHGGADRAMIRAGSRLPIHDAKSSDWIDVGVNLDVSNIVETDSGLQMEVRTEVSSLATENEASPGSTPIIRQVRTSSALVAPIGKTSQVFAVDDPASKHRFQLEVTPTPER